MNLEKLHDLFEKNDRPGTIILYGSCWDCRKELKITIITTEKGFNISGGALYEGDLNIEDEFIGKCDGCFKKDKTLRNFQTCEVYSRVVGYLRPVNQWNPGKQAEFKDRKYFDSKDIGK